MLFARDFKDMDLLNETYRTEPFLTAWKYWSCIAVAVSPDNRSHEMRSMATTQLAWPDQCHRRHAFHSTSLKKESVLW